MISLKIGIALSVLVLAFALLSCELPADDPSENNDNNVNKVSFNANGGEGSIASIVFDPEETGKTLPVNGGDIHRSGYIFISWNTVPSRAGGTEYMQGQWIDAPDNGEVVLYAQWYKEYALRDLGPGGGRIFYRRFDHGTVFKYPEWMYLEANSGEPGKKKWGENTEPAYWVASGDTSDLPGAGLENTAKIAAKFSGDYAAQYCHNLTTNGVDENNLNIILIDDWYLPTRVELYYMNENLHKYNMGGFETSAEGDPKEFYWSSCQKDPPSGNAYVMYFDSSIDTGTQSNSHGKAHEYHVRPVRRF